MGKEQYLTSSLYTFENMREGNYLYVDKTKYLWKMINQPMSMFFFSRPRRFGKSLTLSTLKAIFQGKKELFKNLYIWNQQYDWKSYPVIHIDMGSVYAETTDRLEENLLSLIEDNARKYNINLDKKYPNEAFIELITNLYQRDGKVVILIDEYDKPILNNIENDNLADLQKVMKGFYSVLKTCEPYERFVFITGVGKFLKVSIFSDLNNLTDISMSDDYATMCGYTEKELKENFKDRLIPLAESKKLEYEVFLDKIKNWYDGYRFSDNSENVYNPVSFTKFLENNGKFYNYWFETGSPSIIVKLINKSNLDIKQYLEVYQEADIFTAFMPTKISLPAMMYQTGYLTIKDAKPAGDYFLYKLGFPNFEVEQSFYRRLAASINTDDLIGNSLFIRMYEALESNDIDKMMSVVDTFLAGIPYNNQVEREKYYQSVFYIIFKLIGTTIDTEICTDNGRIDVKIENGDKIYIIEFKLNKSTRVAMKQIFKNEYYKPYEHSDKKITIVGANYNTETHKMYWKKQELF